MDAGMQTIAAFTGTLLRREHTVGQKFVQLIFREGGKNWLCVSSQLTHAKLVVGQLYHIEGVFKQVGDHEYIHEPKIADAKRSGFPVKRLAVFVGIALGILTISGVTFAAVRSGDSTGQSGDETPARVVVAQPVSESTDTTTTTDQTASTPAPAIATPPAATTAKTTTKSTAKTSSTTTQTNTATQQSTAAAASAAYCDPAASVAFQVVHVDDASLPVGTSQTVQDGVDGSQQTCYSDGTPASAQTTVTQQPTDEIIHDGTGS